MDDRNDPDTASGHVAQMLFDAMTCEDGRVYGLPDWTFDWDPEADDSDPCQPWIATAPATRWTSKSHCAESVPAARRATPRSLRRIRPSPVVAR